MRFFSDLAGTLRAAFRVGLGMLDASGLTAARTHALPNKSGTIALLDDVSGGEADIPQQLIDGRWRYTTAEQDLSAGYDLAVFFPTAVNTAVTLRSTAPWPKALGGRLYPPARGQVRPAQPPTLPSCSSTQAPLPPANARWDTSAHRTTTSGRTTRPRPRHSHGPT